MPWQNHALASLIVAYSLTHLVLVFGQSSFLDLPFWFLSTALQDVFPRKLPACQSILCFAFGEDRQNKQTTVFFICRQTPPVVFTGGIDMSKVHLLLVGHWHEMPVRLINLIYTQVLFNKLMNLSTVLGRCKKFAIFFFLILT